MNSLLVSSLAMLGGCIGLIRGADRFVAGAALNPQVNSLDVPVMIGVTLVLAGLLFRRGPGNRRLGRKSGMVFIIFYLAYTAALILSSSSP